MGDQTQLRAWERALLTRFRGALGRSMPRYLDEVRVTGRRYTGSGLYVDFGAIPLQLPVKIKTARGPDFRVLPDLHDEVFLSVLLLENGNATGLEIAACGYFALPEGELDVEFT